MMGCPATPGNIRPHGWGEARAVRGFTLIELAVVITILAIIIAALLSRVWFYQEQAEKAAMQQVAVAIQTALTMEYGSLMTQGKESLVSELAMENPMNWLQRKPANYSGELYDPTPSSVAPGNWVFDLKSRDLVYVLNRSEHFVPGKDGEKWVRYHVHMDYEPAPGGGAASLAGLVFEPVAPYQWFGRSSRQ